MVEITGGLNMNYTALIVAAGNGSRVGLGYNKLLFKLKNGKTILEESVNIFLNDERCTQVVVMANCEDMHAFTNLFTSGKVIFVRGGETRQESVSLGLKVVKEDYVLIHDGARPWLTHDCIDRLLITLEEKDACLLMVPVKDTIKVVNGSEISNTIDRNTLRLAQTPQAFLTKIVYQAYRKADQDHFSATDDAQVVEMYGKTKVYEVMGSYENIKVTTQEDIIGK